MLSGSSDGSETEAVGAGLLPTHPRAVRSDAAERHIKRATNGSRNTLGA